MNAQLRKVSPELRMQLSRYARLAAFTLGSAALASGLVQSWSARVPLLAAILPTLEVIWRAIAPTVPTPPAVSPGVPTTTIQLSEPPAKPPGS